MEVKNRFNGLDLVDRVSEELRMVVHNTQEAVTKTIPKKKKCKKAKWVSEDGFQIAEERREAKCKGKWERFTQLNAGFQRIARTDKKALNEQCKDIEENNRMGKTRDHFNGRYQGNISCKDGQDKRQKR